MIFIKNKNRRLETFFVKSDASTMVSHKVIFPVDNNIKKFQIVRFSPTIRWYPFVHLGGERHCESKVSCLHNTMSPARARTRSARSGVERTNHEATAPPTYIIRLYALYIDSIITTVFVNTSLHPIDESRD